MHAGLAVCFLADFYGQAADAIRRQWLLTLLAGVILIAAFGIALNLLLKRQQGV